ncbi:nuclear transport factor 2 family protein [Agrobacterium rhizogenes]|uniref:SnoaL-like domain-containing protein n=1 Tax=Rhizobium rhizogenes (strain K84 / ATCC BAA-868) TaxID=311403 RepID=B9JQA7_RHIR8|nr:nuclear transport factor 2 family protein [Rhizobium rhizogenes]ACM31326.1 hypothetical protein Arad_12335 [Rhizobium rhizogenes K84]OCJ22075.1 hypothetical protein A6U88_30615 [Agrobacterium sp. B131/95]OCJ24408.1 hypothetical protein A6U89_30725 [Agrobacterium sp. B133/95]NTI46277.1 nuclear transport factor 2 family protein [Rhizobium rhizogenes]NTI52960.1 nuclear transport factor 2 family protein [Rhizobium rhizogenes]
MQTTQSRLIIPAGERALAMWEVQNLMSRHEYYHAAGMNLEEVDALWVARHGPNATTATFASPVWVMNGIETIRRAYGEENQRNREKALKALAGIDLKIKDVPENYGAGHEWAMHTSTTPVIEVAGDGETAKGVWYSPGLGLETKFKGGKIGLNASMFWEKYAGDFINEDGVWKIWHLQMAYDLVPGLPQEMVDPIMLALGDMADTGPVEAAREAGERMSGALPPGFSQPVYSYPVYSPQRPGIMYPRLPEPYYTFSETFSYCNSR